MIGCSTLWGFDDFKLATSELQDAAAAVDAPSASDDGGGIAPAPTFHALDDETRWSSFDVAAVNPAARGFHGVVRDKQYVYFVPYRAASGFHGVVTRYDTAADFSAPSAWTTFDVASLNAGARGFIGGVFDGRYIYLAPYSNGAVHGNIVRYDTLASFTAPAAWTTFDVANVSAAAKGFFGAVFDGRYVYLIPQRNGAGCDGVIARYDTRASFGAVSSWSMFDIAALDASAVGFFSGTFDGRYLYLCPFKDGTSVASSGRIARYDTERKFEDSSSWLVFDASQLTTGAPAFLGATYDGRGVYFGGPSTARFDSSRAFDNPGSWGIVNTAAVSVGSSSGRFVGTSFDTKYLYLVPFVALPEEKPIVIRHRVAVNNLTQPEDWSSFDISRVAPVGANAFWGAAFDGRHVYFAPVSDGVVTRFEAVSDRLDVPIPPSFL